MAHPLGTLPSIHSGSRYGRRQYGANLSQSALSLFQPVIFVIRYACLCLQLQATWLFTVSVTLLYPILKTALGQSNVFAVVWMWVYIPETRGKSLEQIETMLKEGRTDKT